jgi:hypothetical protein
MKWIRKFYVCYRIYQYFGEYEYCHTIIPLNKNEKANIDTFEIKLNEIGVTHKELISWSLIEE